MKVYLGSDHGGFSLKQGLSGSLESAGFEVIDLGSYSAEATDYPDFALAVSLKVRQDIIDGIKSFGVLLCRSGEGMEMAANKVSKIRAALVWKAQVALETRRDNDANILVIPADFVEMSDAIDIVRTFLETDFSGEARHINRLQKLENIEHIKYEN